MSANFLAVLPAINTAAMHAAERWMAANNLRAKGDFERVRLARRVHDRVSMEAGGWLRNGDEMAACGLSDAAGDYTVGNAGWAGILEAKRSRDLLEPIPEAERFKDRQGKFASLVEEIARGLGIPGVRVESKQFGSKEEMEAYLSSLAANATAFAGSKDAPVAAPPPVASDVL